MCSFHSDIFGGSRLSGGDYIVHLDSGLINFFWGITGFWVLNLLWFLGRLLGRVP